MSLNPLMTIHDNMNFDNTIPVYYPTPAEQLEQREKLEKEREERDKRMGRQIKISRINRSISNLLTFLTAGEIFYLGNLYKKDTLSSVVYSAVAFGISKSTD